MKIPALRALQVVFLCGLVLALGVQNVQAKGKKNTRPVARLSHSGDISGTVCGCSDDEPLPGALVYLPGLSIMAKTAPDGTFLLLAVPAGQYDLVVEVPGLRPLTVEGVCVSPRRVTDLGTVAVCPPCSENEDCPAEAYCAKAPGDCEGQGRCEVRPEACVEVYDPVCGCDGKTYGNACEAAAAGVNVAHEGECEVACSDNGDCPDEAYCAKAPGDCEGRGSCEVRPGACPMIYAPVCGCDGKTYGNSCEAAGAGVNVAHEGECLL